MMRGTKMKKIFTIILALLLSISLVSAVSQEELNEAKGLIDSNADCNTLTDDQLETIGEYYMETMHPGEAHELMHKMMGLEEGSDIEEQFHINMAKNMYCNEGSGMMGSGMMGGMMGSGMMSMMGNNMMGFGYSNRGGANMMSYGMMGGSYAGAWLAGIVWFVLAAFVFSAIFWLTYRWLVKERKGK